MHVCAFISQKQIHPSFYLFAVESQDSKDGLSAAGDERKPPPVPEETGKSKVASWLTNQSPASGAQNVKMEGGGVKAEKKVSWWWTSMAIF